MLREEERGGLVVTSPALNEGANNHGQDRDGQGSQQQGDRVWRNEELVAELVKQGCVITPALVGPGIKPVRSAEATRKQRERDKQDKKGLRQINLVAPNDPAAREFLINASKQIGTKRILKALRAALDNPDVVKIGQKVLKLKGEAGIGVRRALGL
jgi:hypothetical protein